MRVDPKTGGSDASEDEREELNRSGNEAYRNPCDTLKQPYRTMRKNPFYLNAHQHHYNVSDIAPYLMVVMIPPIAPPTVPVVRPLGCGEYVAARKVIGSGLLRREFDRRQLVNVAPPHQLT